MSLLDPRRSCSGDMRSMLICALLLATVRVIYSLIHFLSSPFTRLLSVKYFVETPAAHSASIVPRGLPLLSQSQMSHITRPRCLLLCLSFHCCPRRQQRDTSGLKSHTGNVWPAGQKWPFHHLNPTLDFFFSPSRDETILYQTRFYFDILMKVETSFTGSSLFFIV